MNFYDAINHHQFALSEREMAIARQFYDSGREHAGLPDAIDLIAVCRQNEALAKRNAELAAEVARVERRYARLVALALPLKNPLIDATLAVDRDDMEIERWHAIYGGPMAESISNLSTTQHTEP